MRKLTFKGYLLSQLRYFSGLDGVSLYAFSRLSAQNVRLKQALCLYVTLYVEGNLKDSLFRRFPHLATSCTQLSGLTVHNADTFLATTSHSDYRTIYENYVYARDQKEQENRLKGLMHQRIVQVRDAKQVTNYRIYTALRLNPGNANAFLKNGDVSKVSLDTVRRILSYVNGQ